MVGDLKSELRACWRDWRARLARLNALLGRRAMSADWLLRIRARVLAYLVSRYEPAAWEDAIDGPRIPPEPESPETAQPTIVPRVVAGRPPKSGALIRALLEDIHRLNSPRNHASNGLRENHC
jgi:hypothetical protein